MSDQSKDFEVKSLDGKVARDVAAAAPEGKVDDVDLDEVDSGTGTFDYDRSKPRTGTHLYDGNE